MVLFVDGMSDKSTETVQTIKQMLNLSDSASDSLLDVLTRETENGRANLVMDLMECHSEEEILGILNDEKQNLDEADRVATMLQQPVVREYSRRKKPQVYYFLVYHDDGHRNMDTEGRYSDGAVRYLKDEGFSCSAGYWGCPWYFVDIDSKTFKPGRPGVGYGPVIGNHAITLDEFKTVYNIYKQYNGLPLLKMSAAL